MFHGCMCKRKYDIRICFVHITMLCLHSKRVVMFQHVWSVLIWLNCSISMYNLNDAIHLYEFRTKIRSKMHIWTFITHVTTGALILMEAIYINVEIRTFVPVRYDGASYPICNTTKRDISTSPATFGCILCFDIHELILNFPFKYDQIPAVYHKWRRVIFKEINAPATRPDN